MLKDIIIKHFNRKFESSNRDKSIENKPERTSINPLRYIVNFLYRCRRIVKILGQTIKKFLLKIVKLYRSCLSAIFRFLFGKHFILIYNLRRGLQDRGVKGVELLKLKKINDSDLKQTVIRFPEKTIVYIPSHLGFNDTAGECEFEVPQLYCAEIKNATIVGESNILISDGVLYTDLPQRVLDRVDLSYGDLIYNTNRNAVAYKREIYTIEEKAISLIKAGSYNYYHFMVECLSKLVLADEIEEYRGLPILVDSVVKNIKNFKDLLDKCNIYNHPIIWLDKNRHYRVNELVYATSAVFMPGNLRNRDLITEQDFVVSAWLLKKLRDRLGYDIKDFCKNKKIIISRKDTSNSRLCNEGEVVEAFNEHGFVTVYPEKMTIEEQAYIFASADKVVATSGGAMANIMFRRPGTEIYCIIPDDHRFYLYSSMANILGLKYFSINADILKREAYPGLDEFVVDVDELKQIGD